MTIPCDRRRARGRSEHVALRGRGIRRGRAPYEVTGVQREEDSEIKRAFACSRASCSDVNRHDRRQRRSSRTRRGVRDPVRPREPGHLYRTASRSRLARIPSAARASLVYDIFDASSAGSLRPSAGVGRRTGQGGDVAVDVEIASAGRKGHPLGVASTWWTPRALSRQPRRDGSEVPRAATARATARPSGQPHGSAIVSEHVCRPVAAMADPSDLNAARTRPRAVRKTLTATFRRASRDQRIASRDAATAESWGGRPGSYVIVKVAEDDAYAEGATWGACEGLRPQRPGTKAAATLDGEHGSTCRRKRRRARCSAAGPECRPSAEWPRRTADVPVAIQRNLTPPARDAVRAARLAHEAHARGRDESILARSGGRCVIRMPSRRPPSGRGGRAALLDSLRPERAVGRRGMVEYALRLDGREPLARGEAELRRARDVHGEKVAGNWTERWRHSTTGGGGGRCGCVSRGRAATRGARLVSIRPISAPIAHQTRCAWAMLSLEPSDPSRLAAARACCSPLRGWLRPVLATARASRLEPPRNAAATASRSGRRAPQPARAPAPSAGPWRRNSCPAAAAVPSC